MTVVRTVAVHDVVRSVFPREAREEDLVGMAVGRAIDSTLSHIGHEAAIGRRPTAASAQAFAAQRLDEALEESAVVLTATDREVTLARIHEVTRAYRKSVLFGLPRPRSRLLLIGPDVGIYAQPDYWDGRNRFYEMKSYLAIPPRPDVALQLRFFQLAFPGFEAFLVCIDRHAEPVTTTVASVAPPTGEETANALRAGIAVARKAGQERVLEYVDAPMIRMSAPSPGEPDPAAA